METYTLTLDRQDGSAPFTLYDGEDVDEATGLFRSLAPLISGAAVVLTNSRAEQAVIAKPEENKAGETPPTSRRLPGHRPAAGKP